jgi:hypothetical protein
MEQIDRMRAGLLDRVREGRLRAAIEHDDRLSRGCEIWESLRRQFDASAADDPRLTNQLRLRRRAALSGKAATHPRRRFTLPQMALATAASVALTLGIVALTGQQRPAGSPVSPALQLASTDLANAYVSNVVDIELDLTDNVDFYAWMGGQPEETIELPGTGL